MERLLVYQSPEIRELLREGMGELKGRYRIALLDFGLSHEALRAKIQFGWVGRFVFLRVWFVDA